ncbi:Facilitated trehalose transporter Tret1like [Caligus rogercresseyi]|uniref:Facilitated trehalose transporter Tret1like n=1 Tax=Caligus rogercresseyi TaxID=217165 RepID=A0A7T8JX19_CALRO|nr:Facilitated trehalose transporter Tret1like [Caligus rogercresseyi]
MPNFPRLLGEATSEIYVGTQIEVKPQETPFRKRPRKSIHLKTELDIRARAKA